MENTNKEVDKDFENEFIKASQELRRNNKNVYNALKLLIFTLAEKKQG